MDDEPELRTEFLQLVDRMHLACTKIVAEVEGHTTAAIHLVVFISTVALSLQ